MGASSNAFAEFIVEQLAPIGEVVSARFFGGLSLKSQAVLFAMIMDGTLYFVVDAASRVEYEKLGSRCFSYDTKKGRVDVARFYEVPADVLEDQERLVAFAKASINAARKSVARRNKPGRKSAKPKD